MNTIEQAYQLIASLGIKHRLLEGEFSSINTGEKPDVDVLFFDVSEEGLLSKLITSGLKKNGLQSVLYKSQAETVRIDYYIDWINCGYYRLFPVKESDDMEAVYMAYQIAEPIIKFGKYLPRHEKRLNAYLKKYGSFSDEIILKVNFAFGTLSSKQLIKKIMLQDYRLSSRRFKNAALVRNGNMKRMLSARLR